jgi:hypothetical protein
MISVTTVREVSAPVSANQWELLIPHFPSVINYPSINFSYQCRDVFLPGVDVTSETLRWQMWAYNIPVRKDYPREIQIKMEENREFPIGPVLLEWCTLVGDERTGTGYPPSAMTATVLVRLVNYDDTPIFTYVLANAFPKKVIDTPLSYQEDAAVVYNVLFSYDYYMIE